MGGGKRIKMACRDLKAIESLKNRLEWKTENIYITIATVKIVRVCTKMEAKNGKRESTGNKRINDSANNERVREKNGEKKNGSGVGWGRERERE